MTRGTRSALLPKRRGVFPFLFSLLLYALLVSAAAAQVHELSVQKNGPVEVLGGGDFSYVISVTNEETDPAGGIRVRDILPQNVELSGTDGIDWTCSDATQNQQTTVICEYDQALDENESTGPLTLHVTAPDEAGPLSNTASAESEHEDEDSFPWDSNQSEVLVFLESDLRVAKNGPAAGPVYAVSQYDYTFEISNEGPHGADGVTLTDTISGDVVFESVTSADGWSCNSTDQPGGIQIECDLSGTLAVNGDSSLSITVTAPSEGGIVVNQATVDSVNRLPVPPDNESDQVEVEIIPLADLSVEKSVSDSEVDADSNYSYTLAVENTGPSTAQSLVVTDAVPGEAQLLDAAGPDWNCQSNLVQGTLRCTRGSQAPSAVTEITVNVRAPRNAPGGGASGDIESGIAEVASATEDPESDNNVSDSVSTTVNALLALAITKTNPDDGESGNQVTPGQLLEYQITLTNPGPSDAVSDLRPLLDDVFPQQLGGNHPQCNAQQLPVHSPCWGCFWTERPHARARVTTDDGIVSLGGVAQMAVSPDNRHVYATGRLSGAIAVFERSETRGGDFGTLTFQSAASGSDGVNGADALAISPTGLWVAAAGTDTLRLYRRNPDDGSLTAAGDPVENLDASAHLVFGIDGRYLYLAESGASRIRIYSVDEDNGELVDEAEVTDNSLDGVAGLASSPDGEFLYAAAPGSGALVSFEVESDGSLTSIGAIEPALGGQPVRLRAIAVSADGEEVYAAGGGDGPDALFIYERDPADGSLAGDPTVFVRDAAADRLLGDIRSLVASPNGDWLAASAASDQAIAWFERDSEGNWQFENSRHVPGGELPQTPDDEAEPLFPAGLAADRDGEHLYVAAVDSDTLGQTQFSAVILYDLFDAGGCEAGGVDLDPGQLLSGNIDDLKSRIPAGQQVTVRAYARVNNGATAGEMTNTAELTDFNDNIIDDAYTYEIFVGADIQVEKSALNERPPTAGQAFEYRIGVDNASFQPVSGLQLTDQFPIFSEQQPAGFVPGSVSWTCSAEAGSCCNPGGGECGVTAPTQPVSGSLAGKALDLGSNSGITIVATGIVHPDATGTLSNTATAEMPGGIDPLDPDALESTHEADIVIEADAWIEKRSLGVAEDSVTYELLVGNHGPGTTNGLSVNDPLDHEDLNGTGAVWSCEIVAGVGCCGYDSGSCPVDGGQNADGSGPVEMALSMNPGALARFEVNVPLVPAAEGPVLNTATVTAPVEDPDPANDTATVTTRLVAQADLEIIKDILGVNVDNPAVPGEEVAFRISVTNEGPDNVFVGVQDLLPPELEQVAWTCDATTPVPGELTYDGHLLQFENHLQNTFGAIASDDGRNVYVSARGDEDLPSTVMALRRNHSQVTGPAGRFGAISWLETETDGVNDASDSGPVVEGIAGAAGMALSHDQRHLYVASTEANAVAVFRRDLIPDPQSFGKLTFVQARTNGSSQPEDAAGPAAGLNGARVVAVSPDDRHVYVAGERSKSVAVFRRDPVTGKLGYLGRIHAGSSDVAPAGGLQGPTDLAFDPAGRHLYVSNRGTVQFDSASWAPVEFDDAPVGERVFFVPNEVGVAQKWLQQAVSVEAPANTDELTLEFQHHHSFDGTAGQCWDVGVLQISVDGGGSWTNITDAGGVFDSGGYNGVQNGFENNPLLQEPGWCGRNPDWPGFTPVTLDLSAVVFPPGADIRFRWGLGEGELVGGEGWRLDDITLKNGDDVLLRETGESVEGTDGVTVLEREDDDAAPDFGQLSHIQTHRNDESGISELGESVAVALDPAGENVYVAGREESAIVVFDRNPATGELMSIERVRPGDPEVSDGRLEGLTGIAVSPDAAHLLATGRADGMLAVLRRTPFTGELTNEQVLEHGKPDSNPVEGGLAAPAGVVFSPDSQHVYTTDSGTVGTFGRRAPDPVFGFLEAEIDGGEDGFGNEVHSLLGARALAANNEFVYAVGFGQPASGFNGSLVVLKRDRDAGDTFDTLGRHLEFRQALTDQQVGVQGLDGPTGIALVDNHLYVSSERDNAVTLFEIDESTGAVSHVDTYFNDTGGVQGLQGAAAVAVSPDGRYVYVAGRFDHSIAVFGRNNDSADGDYGRLTYQGRVQNGIDGVSGLAGVSGLTLSAGDGHHLYAVSREDHALVVFSVGDDGGLSFQQRILDGFGGEGLDGAVGVTVTPVTGTEAASTHVLVAALNSNAVSVFRRQTDSTLSTYGHLTFVEHHQHGDPGVEALGGARAVAVDRNGDRVYVAAQTSDSLVIFERNNNPGSALYGRLAPLEVRRQDVSGVDGLAGPYGVAISPDGRHVYTAALSSHAVAAFIRRSGSSCRTSGVGSFDEEVFVAARGTVTFLVTGRIRPGATGILENTADLIVPDEIININPDGESDSSVPAPLVPRSELTVNKTNNRLTVVAGSREHYSITVDNAGPSHAVGVAVTDLLTGNDDLVEATAAWTCRAVGSGLLQRHTSISRAELELDELAGLSGVAWAADPDGQTGERLYVASVLGDAVSSFRFDPDTAQLVHIESLADGRPDADGTPVHSLRGARDVVTSSDGRFVYVSSQVDDAVAYFEVVTEAADPEMLGRLQFRGALDSLTPGMSEFDQPQGMSLSPDESHLYVTSANSNALYVLNRDPADGSLSFASRVRNGVDGVSGLGGASAVAVSGDGAHVYVAATNDNALTTLAVDPDNGNLSWLDTRQSPPLTGLAGAASVALAPAGDSIYVAGRDSDAVLVFRRIADPSSPEYGRPGATPVQILNPSSPGLQSLRGPRRVMVSADGHHVYVAGYDAGSVYAFKRDRDDDGRLSFLARYRDGSAQTGLAGASSLAQNESGSYLFAGAMLDSAVTSFARPSDSICSVDSGTGELENFEVDVAAGGTVVIELEVDIASDANGVECPPPLDPGRQCVVNTVSVEVPNQPDFDGPLTVSDASYISGAANLVISKTDGLAEFRGLADARALAITAVQDGYLYVAAPGEPGIGVYRIQPFSGPTGDYPLTFVQFVREGHAGISGLTGISDLVLSSDAGGAVHLYAASALDSSVTWFLRDPNTGRLEFVQRFGNNTGGITGISGASSLTLSPDQRHLYVAGRNTNSIAVFERQHDFEQDNYGGLTFAGHVQSGVGDVSQLIEPVDLLTDPDGRHLYAAARGSSAIVVFRRQDDDTQPGFGGLEQIQVRQNGAAGVSGLLGVSALRLDANGAHLYAAGTGNHSLVHFTRDDDAGSGQFGQLGFVARYTEGENGIDGLLSVSGLTLSADGSRLYATSPADHAVAVFERTTGNGALSWLARVGEGDVQDGPGGPVTVAGLGGARSVVENTDGRVFVAGAAPGSLATLDPAAGSVPAFDGAMLHGDGGAAPGDEVTYTITIVNEGPSDVAGARVRDIFPLEFESVSWECVFEGSGSGCAPSGNGNIDTLVNIANGGRVIFTATGVLRPDVSGTAVNTAAVTLPGNVSDGDPITNADTDDDTVLNARADLAITVEELPQPLVPGEEVEYRLRVTNNGPSDARGGRVRHALPELFAQSTWECIPSREPGLLGLVEQTGGGLGGYGAAAMSPDGRHVYAAGPNQGAGSILMLRRNTLTGELTPESTLANGDASGSGTVDGLEGATHVVVSADGVHVYVAGRNDDAVAVFERDHDDGELSFVEVVRDNIGLVDGLAGVSYLVLSPAGDQLYAVGTLDNAVAVFSRDALTGMLQFEQIVRNGTDGVIDLVLPQSAALSPDGSQLYVAATGSDAVVHFQRAGNGLLTFADRTFQGQQQLIDGELVTVDGLEGVRSLAFAGSGSLYAVSSVPDGEHALVLLRPREDGELRFAGLLRDGDPVGLPPQPVAGLAGAESVAVTADSRLLYIAGADPLSGGRTVAALRIIEGMDLQFLERVEAGAAGDADYPHRLLISADSRHLYSTGGHAPELDVYALQRGSACGREGRGGIFDVADVEAGGWIDYRITARVQANARGVVAGTARVDAAAEVNDPFIGNNQAVFEASLNAQAAVEVTKTLLTEPLIAGLPVSWEITVENHGPSTVRSISVQDDLPTLPGDVPDPGQPGVIAGSAVWECESQPNIAGTQFIHEDGLSGVRGLAYSIDGRWLLAASAESSSISLYERTEPDGWLELRDQVSGGDPIFDDDGDPVGEVSGLSGASAVAVSTDLRHVYVAGREGDSVAVFDLDTGAGELRFIEWRHDGEPSVSGLQGAVALTLSPDGLQLYVAARDDNAVTVFSRNPATGHLEWRATRRDGQGGVPLNTLAGVRDLAMSPDGEFLYAAATQSHAIAVFRRDLFSGDLTFVQRVANGDLQDPDDDPVMVAGLQLVRSIALSPQGGQLYAASLAENSVTLFYRDEITGRLTFERRHADGENGIGGMAGATAVVVGADGERVYVAGLNSGEVAVLDREWQSGHLSFLERRPAGESGTAGAHGIAISPDGGQFAVSSDDQGGAINVMRRLPEGYCGIDSLAGDSLVDVIDLAAGGQLTYTVDAVAHPGARGELINSAWIDLPAGVGALTPSDHEDSDSGIIEAETALRIEKEVDEATLIAGLPVVYTLIVNNEGPSNALGATVSDLLPPGLPSAIWECDATAQSSCAGSGIGDVIDEVDLLVDGTLIYVVEAMVDPGLIGQVTNTATVTAEEGGSDPDLANNVFSVTSPVVAVADAAVDKRVVPALAAPGQAVRYFIEVDNLGPSDAAATRLHDLLPSALEEVSWSCQGTQGAVCPADSGSGDVLLEGPLVSGGRWLITLDALVSPDVAVGSVLTNTATVTVASPVADPVAANNQSSATLTIGEDAAADVIFHDRFEGEP